MKYTKKVAEVVKKLMSEILAHACWRNKPYPVIHARPARTVGRLETFVVTTNIAKTMFNGILHMIFVEYLWSVQKNMETR